MAIFQNIDGTLKSSFRIGPRGITLSTKTTEQIKDSKPVQELLANNKALMFKDELTILDSVCKMVDGSEPGKLKFYLKSFDVNTWQWVDAEEPIVVDIVSSNEMRGPDQSTADNIAVFEDDTGKKLKDSGYSVSSKIYTPTYDGEKETSRNPIEHSDVKIPTVEAVIGYIGDISLLLENRMNGEY